MIIIEDDVGRKFMPFSEDIKTKAMVACGRYCCVCHKFCGNNMEVHHIKAHADGGADTFENAIPLCFDCHAEVRQYDSRHPKGIKFSEKELIQHRDNWYKKITTIKPGNQQDKENKNSQPLKIHHEKNYEQIMLRKADTGKDILLYLSGACGINYDADAKTLDEVRLIGDFIQYIKEILDFDDLIEEPCDRMMTSYNLSESIKELDDAGFWIFVGKENRVVTGGIGESEAFPVFIMRVVRKDSHEIIKNNSKNGEPNEPI
jgi:hypothetical protein